MRGRAYAKVNLSLEVLGRREDGYHELVSVFQTVSLYDELSLEASDSLTLACDVASLAGDDNLVLRAARLLGRGGRFHLRKGIPMAGGMGGGSSDAALALRLLDALYGLRLPPQGLRDAAAALGSDVPFFLTGGTALVQGRGERVTPLPDLPMHWLAVLNPGVPLSTPTVFRGLRPPEYSDGAATLLAGGVGLPPSINSLQASAERLEPRI
ncbi:MAG: 4-(cytidine 5'-diphospho)-2-C-methyl-D-erythritol kinase, partial [Chloroflexi bacterium]|nr:4-(cytidine 5'-diphospho)-2-C-methyl-D-erythritol kinase [Chloroflexota bacterium]